MVPDHGRDAFGERLYLMLGESWNDTLECLFGQLPRTVRVMTLLDHGLIELGELSVNVRLSPVPGVPGGHVGIPVSFAFQHGNHCHLNIRSCAPGCLGHSNGNGGRDLVEASGPRSEATHLGNFDLPPGTAVGSARCDIHGAR